MKRDDNWTGKGLATLGRVIDAYGADAERWPAEVRERLKKLINEQPAARARLAEARALDRLLDLTPRASIEHERALTERIVAAAIASPAGAGARGRVIPFPRARQAVRPSLRTPVGSAWQTAALLAASLLVGLYIGGSVSVNPVLQEFADQIGIAADFDQTALAEDSVDEDVI